MDRLTWLKYAGSTAFVFTALPVVGHTQVIVTDPLATAQLTANYGAMLRQLANDFIHNKNELAEINLLFQQWNAMKWEHGLNISQIWSDIAPYINKFQTALNKNDNIATSTKDIFTAIVDTFPDFNPTTPIPDLIAVYQDYMRISARNAIASAELQKKQQTTRTGQLADIKSRASAAQTETDKYTAASQMSAYTAEGIDMLNASVSSEVGLFGRYVEEQVSEKKATAASGRLLFAQQLLDSASGSLAKSPSKYTADQYASNPNLLGQPTVPHP